MHKYLTAKHAVFEAMSGNVAICKRCPCMTGAAEHGLSPVCSSERFDVCQAVADKPCCNILQCKQVHFFAHVTPTILTPCKSCSVERAHGLAAYAVPCNQLRLGQHASAGTPVSGVPQTV